MILLRIKNMDTAASEWMDNHFDKGLFFVVVVVVLFV